MEVKNLESRVSYIEFRYISQTESFYLYFQYGGANAASTYFSPTEIGNVVATAGGQVNGKMYEINADFSDPNPK